MNSNFNKALVIFLGLFALAYNLFGISTELLASDVWVNGYYRKDGTYVSPHYRSAPDGNPYNNWSFPGNLNPYTGSVAVGDPSTYMSNYCSKSPNNPYCVGSYFNYYSGYSPEFDIYKNYKPSRNKSYSSPSNEGYSNFYDIQNYNYQSCESGYSWNFYNKKCEEIVVPSNAHLNPHGTGWNCNSGYKINPQTAQCEKVSIQSNVHLNPYGTGWVCDNGYKINHRTAQCQKQIIPQNIEKDSSGEYWVCEKVDIEGLEMKKCSKAYLPTR